MKISNTWKHLTVSLAVLLAIWTVTAIANYLGSRFQIFWFVFIALCFYAIRLEYLQWKWSHKPLLEYLQIRWLDTLIDLAAGILPYLIGGWLLGLT